MTALDFTYLTIFQAKVSASSSPEVGLRFVTTCAFDRSTAPRSRSCRSRPPTILREARRGLLAAVPPVMSGTFRSRTFFFASRMARASGV
ncbi:MAG: hypothetical protein BWX71_02144 [Deltaproteobacteria bacterium ADurb.Bin072]|nr:MAG: hypothetical protein BWX71_02144 [Deltaproteobacteria bacterium ADurb.Bin072]